MSKDYYNTEINLHKFSFNMMSIINSEKTRAIVKSDISYIVFNCGNMFFSDLIDHPSVYSWASKRLSIPLCINRNYLKEYCVNVDKLRDFFLVDDVMFIVNFDTNIKQSEAIFETDNYISVLKNCYLGP